MNLLFKSILSSAFFCFLSQLASAQTETSPVVPLYKETRKEIGFFVSLGQNYQSGDLYTDCITCQYKDGVKFGYSFGALYEQNLGFSSFSAGASIAYSYLGVQSTFHTIEAADYNYQVGGTNLTGKVNAGFSYEGKTDLSFLTIAPYIKWNPFKFMFLRAGLGASFALSSNFTNTKSLESNTAKIKTGEIVGLYFDNVKGRTSVELQNSELKDLKSFQLFLNPAIGFNIPFSKSVTLSPIYEHSIALSKLSDSGKDLAVNYWRIIFELRIALKGAY
jgi:hypothetical protein